VGRMGDPSRIECSLMEEREREREREREKARI
jgi:hypothetical protein